jgi:deazaflavin-dependent oxidoreductase (nitroreductase family)
MEDKITFFGRVAQWVENAIMTRLVPKDSPGVVFKWLFKIPILFYKVGLPLFGDFILLLTTTGRKSGKPRYSPLEYRREEGSGYFVITAGWGGNTDWVKNLRANPNVHLQAGRRHFDARAESLTDDEVAAWLLHAVQVNPASLKIWSRWAGEVLDGSLESMYKAARYFPSFRLIPL